MRLLLVSLAFIAVITHVVSLFLILNDRHRNRTKVLQSSILVVLLAPIAVLLISAVGSFLSRLESFEIIGTPDAAKKQEFLSRMHECDFLCQLGTVREYTAVVLVLLAATGIASMIVVLLRIRRYPTWSIGLPVAGIGTSILGAVFGYASYRHSTISHATDQHILAERVDSVSSMIAELTHYSSPISFQLMVWTCGLVIGISVAIPFRKKKQSHTSHRKAIFAGIILLMIGILAFAFSRKHSLDMEETFEHMIRHVDKDGYLRLPGPVESYVFGTVARRESRGTFLSLDSTIDLPKSKTSLRLWQAPTMHVSQSELRVIGVSIDKLSNGRFDPNQIALGQQVHCQLYKLFSRFSDLGNDEESFIDERVVSILMDKAIPFETLWRILQSTAMAGYSNYRLVVVDQNNQRLFQQQLSRIYVSTLNEIMTASKSEASTANQEEMTCENMSANNDGVSQAVQKRIDWIKECQAEQETLHKIDLEDIPMPVPEEPIEEQPEPIRVAVKLSENCFELFFDKTSLPQVKIPKKNGDYDYDALTNKAIELKRRYPGSETVVVMPDNSVKYQVLIKTLDALREQVVDDDQFHREILFPLVILAPFDQDLRWKN